MIPPTFDETSVTARLRALELRNPGLILICIIGLGAVLRLYKLTAVALWFDESVSVELSGYPWSELLGRAAEDIGPPLYFVVLKLWRSAFGDSILALRSLSLICEVLAVWLAYVFVRHAFREIPLAHLAALFLAVNPLQIQYARETRMYAMGVCLVLLASVCLARAFRSWRWQEWVGYGVAAASCLYTHYYLGFAIAAQGLVALGVCLRAGLGVRARAFGLVALAYGVAAALFVPWVPTLIQQVRRVREDFWIPPLTSDAVMRVMWTLVLGGGDAAWMPSHWAAVMTVALSAVLAFTMVRSRGWPSWLVISQAAVPLMLALALSVDRSIFIDRYLLFASAFWSILMALAIRQLPVNLLQPVLAAGVVVVSLAALALNLNAIYLVSLRNPVQKPGMAGAAAFVNRQAAPGDAIVIPHSLIFFSFKYYNRTGIRPMLYATIPLEQFAYYAGRSILEPSDLTYDLRQLRGPKRVWYIWTDGFYQHKGAVPETWRLEGTHEAEDTPAYKGSIYVDEYLVPE